MLYIISFHYKISKRAIFETRLVSKMALEKPVKTDFSLIFKVAFSKTEVLKMLHKEDKHGR